jgi:hypothetical protein
MSIYIIAQKAPKTPKKFLKFLRREDLTADIRLHISYTAHFAQINKTYGAITQLAKDYAISRAFIYILLFSFRQNLLPTFSPIPKTEKVSEKKEAITEMLLQRMVGKSSIEAISAIMKYHNSKYSSVGAISENLSKIGEMLPNTLGLKNGTEILLTFASDEVFAKSQPILITVDPKSSVILRIELAENRNGDTWAVHFEIIEKNGITALNIVSDAGTGLKNGIKKALKNTIYQPDTFHAIAYRLGKYADILLKNAYKMIKKEYEAEKIFYKIQRETVIEAKFKLYMEAREKAEAEIEIYENFLSIYQDIISLLEIFDEIGELADRTLTEEKMAVAFKLIQELGNEKLNKEVEGIKKLMPNLLNYFDQAKQYVEKCQELNIDKNAIKSLFLEWQWEKNIVKSKKKKRKIYTKQQRDFYAKSAKKILKNEYETTKEKVFDELNNIIQSSSIVENINSILRPYLNGSKNQLNQNFLNLFMFYHNHRRYLAGKRKGKTPMELLTKNEQKEDWIELLLQTIEEKQPSFFL